MENLGSNTNHVGLEEGTLEVDVVVVQSLVDGSQNNLSHLLGTVQVMLTWKNKIWCF